MASRAERSPSQLFRTPEPVFYRPLGGGDGKSLLYPIFFLLGAGSLFPWNAFINASSYFSARFCGSDRSGDFLSFFGLTSSFASCISLALCVRYGFKEVVVPLSIYASVFIITAVLVLVKDVEPNFLFLYTLISLAVVGSCGAFMSGGIFGLAAVFPPVYTQAIMSGQGLAGLIVSLASITTTAIGAASDTCGGEDDDGNADADSCEEYTTNWSAFIYFCFAILILLICIAAYLTLERLPITQYYKDLANSPAAAAPPHTPRGDGEESEQGSLTSPLLDVNASRDSRSSSHPSSSLTSTPLSIFLSVLPLAAAVFGVFAVSLAVFPSFTTQVVSESQCVSSSRFFNDMWIPFSFLNFNIGDFAGRQVPLLLPLPSSPASSLARSVKVVTTLSFLRLSFVPLFLFCNIDGTVLPVLFSSDAYPLIFMFLLALSNGAIASYAMMLGPAAVKSIDMERAGNVMVLSLQMGLLAGSIASFGVLKVGTGKW